MDAKRLARTVRRHRAMRRWARVAEVLIVVVSAAAAARVVILVAHHSSL
jgi:hypothetical protein